MKLRLKELLKWLKPLLKSRGPPLKRPRSCWFKGKEHERVIGVKTDIEVFKSSVWKPYHKAEVYILFDYGIDDIRANLKFIKANSGDSVYKIGEINLGKSMEGAIQKIEEEGLEKELKEKVIELWNEIEEKFDQERKPRIR